MRLQLSFSFTFKVMQGELTKLLFCSDLWPLILIIRHKGPQCKEKLLGESLETKILQGIKNRSKAVWYYNLSHIQQNSPSSRGYKPPSFFKNATSHHLSFLCPTATHSFNELTDTQISPEQMLSCDFQCVALISEPTKAPKTQKLSLTKETSTYPTDFTLLYYWFSKITSGSKKKLPRIYQNSCLYICQCHTFPYGLAG